MLDQRIHRYRKKSREESECGQQRRNHDEGAVRNPQRRSDNRHPNRAQRDQSIFDLARRKISSRNAAHADADRERGGEIGGTLLANMKNVAAVNQNRGDKQRAQKPEVGIAQNSQ